MRRFAVLAVAFYFGAPCAWAAVTPNALFSDHAVLQRGKPIAVWGTAAAGEKVTVKIAGQEASATAGQDGKWQAQLPALQAGGPFEMTIAGENTITLHDVLVGEVWLASGQSNMQWAVAQSADPERTVAEATHPFIRLLTVPRQGKTDPQATAQIAWSACTPETIGEFSAVAYHFGRNLHEALGVPVGLINTSYGGTPAEAWTTREKLASTESLKPMLDEADAARANYPAAKQAFDAALAQWEKDAKVARDAGQKEPPKPQPPREPEHPHQPMVLYNAMIHPLVPYGIAGAIWYQGESNAGRAWQYRTLFPAMITSWREVFGQGDFPFLFVQLAPFMKIVDQPQDSAWAELREAQSLTTTAIPNAAMAVITDVGEEQDIHPKKKAPVGARLALAARALAYGDTLEYSGPVFAQQEVRGNQVVLHFTHAGYGLRVGGPALRGFTIAGADAKFVNAEAVLDGNRVIVSSPQVAAPVAVRYGWADFPLGNLWNENGLPASPFRTDSFPVTTQPK